MKYDVRLMSVDDLSGMPGSGTRLVVVARNRTDDTLHFRIFDREGRMALNKSDTDFPGKSSESEALKGQLASMWAQQSLTGEQQRAILDAVTSISGQTLAVSMESTRAFGEFLLLMLAGCTIWGILCEVSPKEMRFWFLPVIFIVLWRMVLGFERLRKRREAREGEEDDDSSIGK